MCIKIEKTPPKKYVSSKFAPDTIIYCKQIDKKDPDIFYVNNDEMAFVICYDGTSREIMEPGFYRIIGKPIRVIWIKKVPREIKIGVPKEATGKNIGFHARIRLHPIDWNIIYEYFDLSAEEHEIRINDIKEIIRESALSAFLTIINSASLDDINQIKRKFNEELNKVLSTTKLAGFAAIVSHLGLSNMCKLPTDIFESIGG